MFTSPKSRLHVHMLQRLPPHPAFHRTPTKSFAVEIASAAYPTMPIPSSSSSPIIPLRSRGLMDLAVGIGIADTDALFVLSSAKPKSLDRRDDVVDVVL